MIFGNRFVSRRSMIQAAALTAGWATLGTQTGFAQTPEVLPDELVIDMAGGPDNLDPALARSVRDWSIVHSIYDSILDLGSDGSLVPLAAVRFEVVDKRTFEVVLREGLTFHDGTSLRSDSIERSITHVQQSEGPAAGNFQAIERVEIVDELTARIVTTEPAPWLPSQLAVWMVLFPETSTPESFETGPVGSGPYRFVSREPGDHILLERNPDYLASSPKGQALAETVRFRFVPESTTRVADLATGTSHLITEIPSSQLAAVTDGGATAVEAPVVGSAFIRIATDVAPFDDPSVRQALNHAIDVGTIGEALVSPEARRLASLFPDERSMAFNPDLEPYAYDPELARQLLTEAGYEGGFETELEMTSGARVDAAEAIAAQLAEVGISVTITVAEYTDFNATWKDDAAPALRMATWSPLYDPHTLLSLVFASEGFLSRYANPEVDALIESAASEVDQDARVSLYRELATLMYEDVPAVYLWNLTAGYGVAEEASAWQPRGDEYVIPTVVEEPV